MSKPIPTAPQLVAINEQIARLTAQQASLLESSDLQDSEIDRWQLIDDAFKNVFDWYDQDIVTQYDQERKAINGIFPIGMVTETDIVDVSSNPPIGRLVPTYPTTAIVRISEFDGSPTDYTAINELVHLADQVVPEDKILISFGGTSPVGVTGSTTTTTAITPVSTSVGIIDTVNEPVFSIGDRFVIHDGTSSVVVEVISVTDTTPPISGTCSNPFYTDQVTCEANFEVWTPDTPPPPPPFTYTLGIIQIVSGTLIAGASLDTTFTIFSDSERATKTPSASDYQNIMDYLVDQLEIPLNARLARLAEQLAALNLNDDPYGVTELGTAIANVTANQSFLNAYLLTTDISDAGMAALVADRLAQTILATNRVTEIVDAYTLQTENFYDARYDIANGRADLSKGTLRALQNAQNVKTVMINMAGDLQGMIDALTAILP